MYSNKLLTLILNTDSYKASHWLQYPPNTEYLSYYIEARRSEFDVVVFGLQAFIKSYLLQPISMDDINEAEATITAHGLPFHREGWQRLIEKHQGYLPLKIEALLEGSIVPAGNVICQITNTDPEFFWLAGYLETALLRGIWYPSTVASLSYFCKLQLKNALSQSADNLESLDFKLHDFGARGVSSAESAMLGGLAHLVNFKGTDNLPALLGAKRWYHANTMPAFSIPAAEHSTITAWGESGESDAYRNMVQRFSGEGKAYSVVSDSYNLWNAVEHLWGEELKSLVEASNGTLIIRPDSGDPAETVCRLLHILAEKFGHTRNRKGYKCLPSHIRILQGDGINAKSLTHLLNAIMNQGFSLDNVNFGMGGGLLQQVTRDTMSWAMKASAICIAGQWHDICKNPITSQTKRSKKGILALIQTEQGYKTIKHSELGNHKNQLVTVFENGKLLIDEDLETIRKRADQGSNL